MYAMTQQIEQSLQYNNLYHTDLPAMLGYKNSTLFTSSLCQKVLS